MELDDIQGIVARGYSTLKSACFLMLAVTEPAAARAALGRVAPRVTDAAAEPPDTAVNLAVTADGLRHLGPLPADLDGFPDEFVSGMTDPNRSRLLGDVGENAPAHWRWGGPATPPVHVLVMLYARDEERLGRLETELRQDLLTTGGLTDVVRLTTAALTDREPFGFRDGISQPLIEGLPRTSRAVAAREGGAATGDVVKAGEFLLGYPNEYGLLTDRPVLPDGDDPAGLLPRASDGADFGRNGSYLVFRQLHQDVEGFWSHLDAVTRRPDGTPDAAARDALAARMVGRWPSGAPLVHAPRQDDPRLATDNDFGYFTTDPDGLRCPLGAHIRRAHPRDSLDPRPGSADSVAIGRRHRILRRGRAYGPQPEARPSGDGESGLHFLCLNANISRQFEFIQHTWLNNPNFNGLHDAPDPLVAPRNDHRSTFTEQARPLRTRHLDLPQFVSVQGGAYFFLPGLRALRYLCAAEPAGGRR